MDREAPTQHLEIGPDVVNVGDRLLSTGVAVAGGFVPFLLGQQGQSLAHIRPFVRVAALALGEYAGVLQVADRSAALVETDLMEWTDGDRISCDGDVELVLGPFEIRTYKIG